MTHSFKHKKMIINAPFIKSIFLVLKLLRMLFLKCLELKVIVLILIVVKVQVFHKLIFLVYKLLLCLIKL